MSLKIGLLFNTKENYEKKRAEDLPDDIYDDMETRRTANGIKRALTSLGHSVDIIEADENAFGQLRRNDYDLVFNMSEGIHGESRESHMPVLLETLGIPYTGSGPLTLALGLNKARTKEILENEGVDTPKFQVFNYKSEELKPELKFPLIVKPVHEGASIGINRDSIVNSKKELRQMVHYIIKSYSQPALVEEFIDGREFAVNIIGNNSNARILPIVEISHRIEKEEIVLDMIDSSKIISAERDNQWVWDKSNNDCYITCPAQIPKRIEEKINKTALECYELLNCKDWARVDIRLRNETPFVIEINPMPGFSDQSPILVAAKSAGMSYEELIGQVLSCAIERYHINNP